LVYLLVLLFPNSRIMLFWEFYFLPFSVHVQTTVIYVALLSLLWWNFFYYINLFISYVNGKWIQKVLLVFDNY
jgi:hypothetical protein